jgi:hypothetical protein
MGQAIPNQHPSVVLRSHFNQLRALLAVALIAVTGLTVAVVILATDEEQVISADRAAPSGQLHYGGFNPATGTPESVDLPRSQSTVGPSESSTAAAIGTAPSTRATAGSSESSTAAAIGTADDGSSHEGGPDESVVAGAVSGR